MNKTSTPFRLCLIVAALLLPGMVKAELTFTTNSGAITITGWNGRLASLEIPATLNGFPVTSIGNGAFDGAAFTNLSIPTSVTNIGNGAFGRCHGLTNITLPNSISTIGDSAFEDCYNVVSITLPANVTSIGDGAFAFMQNLAAITIPNSVTRIGKSEFVACTNLTGIILPAGVTNIGSYAFQACENLKVITIPLSVTEIGYQAFYGCTSLAHATIPGGVTIVRDSLFAYCSNLTDVFLGDGVTFIQDNAFVNCTRLQAITLPNSITSIGDEAFASCSSLPSITIPNGVTSIGYAAFGSCTKLTGVLIPNSVTSISNFAFGGCQNLTNIAVEVLNPAYSSLDGVLFNKNSTTLVEFPAGISGSYSVPTGVIEIESWAFASCTKLTEITLPDSVTDIGSRACEGCTKLSHIAIPSSVIGLGDSAFENCVELSSITIPAGVPTVGDRAFAGCVKLTDVDFGGNAPSADPGVFDGDTLAIAYYLPGTSGWSSPFSGIPALMLNPPNPAGSLQVNLTPSVVANDDAEWRVDGGIPQTSGNTVLGLSVGNHTISFGADRFGGWSTPTDLIIHVSANSTTVADGVYTTTVPPRFTVTVDNGAAIITSYDGYYVSLDVPATLQGMWVTGIGEGAFRGSSGLTRINLPETVLTIAAGAFAGCPDLTEIGVDTLNPAYASLDGVLFDKNKTALVGYPSAVAGPYSIPGTVIRIADAAFDGCSRLTHVDIPGSVTVIGMGAFSGCSSLVSVTIPGGVTAIPDNAFYDCEGMTSVTIPDTVTSIGEQAFALCGSLPGITIPRNVASIGNLAFSDCANLNDFHFLGDPPVLGGPDAFAFGSATATVHFPSGSVDWGVEYGGLPAVPEAPGSGITGIGVQNQQFGFTLTGSDGQVLVVDVSADLIQWLPVQTNVIAGNPVTFVDPQSVNHVERFYRLRSQ